MDRGEPLLRVDLDAAEGVDDLGEPGEVHHQHVIDPDLGVLLHGLHHQRQATPGVRCVDLRLAAPTALLGAGDRHPGVPGYRDELRAGAVLRHMRQDDGVRPRTPGALRIPRVAAEDQHVQRALGDDLRPALLGYALESVKALDVGLDRLEIEAGPYRAAHPDQGQHQHTDQRDPQPPSAWSSRRGRRCLRPVGVPRRQCLLRNGRPGLLSTRHGAMLLNPTHEQGPGGPGTGKINLHRVSPMFRSV